MKKNIHQLLVRRRHEKNHKMYLSFSIGNFLINSKNFRDPDVFFICKNFLNNEGWHSY